MPPEWLLWVRAGTLVAQRLDLARSALTGDPFTLADSLAFDVNSLASAVSASTNGLVAYRPGSASRRQLGWFDRSGKALGTAAAADESGLNSPRLSPDGRRVAVWRGAQGNSDIWLLDGTRMSRFTFEAALDRWPIWSPDGSRIVFDSVRQGRQLYVKPSSGDGGEELLLESSQEKIASDWSADGRFILYHVADPQTGWDVWVLPLAERKPWAFLKTNFNERQAQFSPDGRWVSYMSNESGSYEIYVRPFAEPAAGGASADRAKGQWQRQVSTAGGIFPRWHPSARELYYLAPDSQFMAARIGATGTTPEPGTPVALFHARIVGGGLENGQGPQYDVARDGRFLINTPLDAAASPITLLQNWKPQP
jgi:dipeptidyl aminopeptidase/acylaminoacyl peptidase